MTESPAPYRVLARKYRPRTFAELIGQDAMVQTLANAIRRDRLAHAFLMTGVRGVGKTSTARLIAKALNCIGPDGQGGPTIDPCGQCEPCRAIAEGRHIDVIEMDAASHTGVDDVREIIEAVRYAAVSARFKIYIIDEVHMLSKNAFNALLKTLEEPPEHVKFLFATTEVNKVPVTVLSRCQRFDLRRIPASLLQAHFAHVVEAEGVSADAGALALIAAAAEGSARDGLSILDQAIAHAEADGRGAAHVAEAAVREMLGLSDRGAARRLFGAMLAGEVAPLVDGLAEQHVLGVEPLAIMGAMLDLVHAITLAKAGRAASDPAQSEEERAAIEQWTGDLGFAQLHRLWQLLLKGQNEVANAPRPMEACEMALLRVVHAASLPDPSELARLLREGGAAQPATPAPAPVADSGVGAPPPDFASLVALLDTRRPRLANELHDCCSLVRYAPPELVIALRQPLAADFVRDVTAALLEATGARWSVTIGDAPGAPTLLEQQRAREAEDVVRIKSHPVVAAALDAFPGAELLPMDDNEAWSATS
jgi:DNA polymerase-3 subunit gamma/tau